MFAVVVTFRLHSGKIDAFHRLIHENAATSLRAEPGCHQFDVATDAARPNEVFLYEIYQDESAFEAHLKTSHFASFDAASADMIATKNVRTFRTVRQ